MSDESKPDDAVEAQLQRLEYAGPRVCRRYQAGAFWKSIVRVTGGVLVLQSFLSFILAAFTVPTETYAAILILAAVVGLATMITWERGLVLKTSVWDDARDRRAAEWRASASRFDSSGVTILDPHAQGRKE